MKTIRKIFLFAFVFVLAIVAFSFSNAKVKADPLTTSNKIIVEGAAIRTTGNAGMKFAANIGDYDTTNVTAYGIAIAYGSVSVSDDFKVGGTVGGKAVLSNTVDELDNEGKFYIVLWNIPEASYIQDVTARAFVIDNGNYVYGDSVTVRNIYQVASAVKEDVGYVTNDYIEGIVSAFHTVTYHYNGPLVGYASYAALVTDFMSDFNTTTNKSIAASGLYGAGNAHATFFNNDAMNAKWSWLIDSLENLRQHGYGTHDWCATSYANAKAKTLTTELADTIPLRQNVQGFMTKTKCATYSGYVAIDFSLFAVQDLMFATMTKNELVKNGSALVSSPTREGYTFAGWYDNPSFTGSPVENVGEHTDLYAKWNLTTYDVTFMDGEAVLDLSPSTYNIFSSFDLPNYSKAGYTFDGWYDNPSFTGSAKTAINVGTLGDLVFYAKTTESSNVSVNVVLNPNGGILPKGYNNADSTRTISVSTYDNTGNASGIYMCSSAITSMNSLRWQYKILLKYDASLDLYEVVATDAATKAANTVASDAGVTWTHALSSSGTNISTYASVGQYIALSIDELAAVSFNAYVFNSSSYTGNYSTSYILATSLPTPVREGYTFAGWLSSYDSSIVTEVPGYLSDPGEITYTAQWEAN